MEKKPIRSFHDLDVYQNSYEAMRSVFNEILPKLPAEEKYNLALAWTKFGERDKL